MWRKRKLIPMSERLRSKRDELGLSVDEVTKQAGIPFVTYVKIERWESDNPYFRNVVKVARILGISLDDLARDMYLDEE